MPSFLVQPLCRVVHPFASSVFWYEVSYDMTGRTRSIRLFKVALTWFPERAVQYTPRGWSNSPLHIRVRRSSSRGTLYVQKSAPAWQSMPRGIRSHLQNLEEPLWVFASINNRILRGTYSAFSIGNYVRGPGVIVLLLVAR